MQPSSPSTTETPNGMGVAFQLAIVHSFRPYTGGSSDGVSGRGGSSVERLALIAAAGLLVPGRPAAGPEVWTAA